MRIVRSDLKSIVGQVFENWTVLERDIERSINSKTLYVCKCKCGTVSSVRFDMLKNGRSTSCGCLKKEKLAERCTIHGFYKHPLYQVWITLKQRCSNPNNARFKHYGGKGVKVCEEWEHDFQTFYDWAFQNGYQKGLTIDRRNNDGNYSPENCRFITNKKQQLNRSNNRMITCEGKTLTVKEWCDIKSINRNKLNWRLNNGWKEENIFK